MKLDDHLSAITVVPGEIDVPIAELASSLGATEAAIKHSLGRMRVRRTERLPTDLAREAALGAIAKRGISPEEIDVIFFCSTGRDEHINRVLKLAADIGSPNVQIIQVVGGCGVIAQTIELAQRWLAGAGGGRALILYVDARGERKRAIGEISESTIRTLMSDAAAALFVESGTVSALEGRASPHLDSDARLSLLGYGVSYNTRLADLYSADVTEPHSQAEELQSVVFTIHCARTAFAQCLAEAGLALADVRWFIHPLEAKALADLVLRKLDISPERRLTNPTGISHPLGADSFFELHDALAEGRVARGDTVAIVARELSSVHCLLLRRD